LSQLADWLLQLGQAAECRVLLDRIAARNRDALGELLVAGAPHRGGLRWNYRLHTFDWLDLRQCAAAGNYIGAVNAIDRLAGHIRGREQHPAAVEALAKATTEAAIHLGSEVLLGAPPASAALRILEAQQTARPIDFLTHERFHAVARADLDTLAGVLELERGDIPAAERRFENAKRLYLEYKPYAPALPGEPLAIRYYDSILGSR
jgi:hypothetical protein